MLPFLHHGWISGSGRGLRRFLDFVLMNYLYKRVIVGVCIALIMMAVRELTH